jgi:hypothetical protein
MLVDAIILTNSSTEKAVRSTLRTMYTLRDSETDHNFNIHLVESGIDHTNVYMSLVANYMKPNEPFNYNRFINHALYYLQGEWVIISNNDVGYERGWFSEMMKIHEMRPDIQSFSPRDPMLYMKYFDWHFIDSPDNYYESYLVTEAVMGWCIVVKRTALDKIVPFELVDVIKSPYHPVMDPNQYPGCNTWEDTVEYIKAKIDTYDYDVLIAGSTTSSPMYAEHARQQGKVGIQTGGVHQLFFGILGYRWSPEAQNGYRKWAKLYNQHWMYPMEIDEPVNRDKYKFLETNYAYW